MSKSPKRAGKAASMDGGAGHGSESFLEAAWNTISGAQKAAESLDFEVSSLAIGTLIRELEQQEKVTSEEYELLMLSELRSKANEINSILADSIKNKRYSPVLRLKFSVLLSLVRTMPASRPADAKSETLSELLRRAEKRARVENPRLIPQIRALREAAKAEVTTKKKTIAPTAAGKQNQRQNLPPLPKGLTWPTETFSAAVKKGENIVSFLERVWLPLIQAGFGELRWLRAVDPSAAQGVNNFERVDPATGERRRLPTHVRLLTKKESNDRKLLRGLEAFLEEPQLARTVVARLRRGVPLPAKSNN